MPRVSVIVAARDAASTLPQTLESVAAQDFADWEIVLVDDGSEDATGSIAAGFGERLTLLRNEDAAGPAAARNRAVAAAGGELLAFLDADDCWRGDYLSRQVAALDAAGPDVAIAACDATFCGPAGEPLPGHWFGRVQRPAHFGVTELLRENPLHSKTLVRRSAFAAAGGFSAYLRRAEDYDLWLRMVEQGAGVIADDEPLVVLRLRPDSLSAQSEQLAEATAEVYRRALERGNLDRRQCRLARRQRRLLRLVAARARAAEAGSSPGRRAGVRAMSALVALEHPERWLPWLRRGVRTAGPTRHA